MYLDSYKKAECYGCNACTQSCNKNAIKLVVDDEGFWYPQINKETCINCGLCKKVCPYKLTNKSNNTILYAFGGYILDENIKKNSTSGGAFSAIVKSFCDENYVIFGARAEKFNVYHSYVNDVNDIGIFRKSKYVQSNIGTTYKEAKQFLKEGKKVLFSGTPCQISGLLSYLNNVDKTYLLTVEVVCEGVPSPLYIKKYDDFCNKKYSSRINEIDYRYKGKSFFGNGKWDFQALYIKLQNKKEIVKDRWFVPFWSIWLQHLMSRPSCYYCEFATDKRLADITLGDLWGVHLYCPELYGKNSGASLIVSNTDKGVEITKRAQKYMYGHELKIEDVLKYQSPLRKHIENNVQKEKFMNDLCSPMSYEEINKKWAKKPTIKLLWQKYIFGNRQKIFIWNIKNKRKL